MSDEEREKKFCEKLTELLRKYGYGIADEPHIFYLESIPENDYVREARIVNGRLEF